MITCEKAYLLWENRNLLRKFNGEIKIILDF